MLKGVMHFCVDRDRWLGRKTRRDPLSLVPDLLLHHPVATGVTLT